MDVALKDAASNPGSEEMLRLLLANGAKANMDNVPEGLTALSQAVYCGAGAGIVRVLLEHGADPDVLWLEPNMTLSWAAHSGQEDVVRLLIEKGAKVDPMEHIAGGKIAVPLVFAAARGHLGIVKILLDNGANVNADMDGRGETALKNAGSNGHHDVVDLLLENGAERNT